jgi:hypothetical protein
MPDQTETQTDYRPSDQELETLARQRFQERVNRVLAVMREERVDWRAVPYVTPDGRIAARVAPVEMQS